MSKTSHLYRRGNNLYFRLSVPNRFRVILKFTQFTQSLHTQNRKDAIPAAYKLASEAKILFNRIDSLMIENDDIDDDLLRQAIQELDMEDWAASVKLSTRAQGHKKELALMKLKAITDALDKITSLPIDAAPASQQVPITAKVVESNAPLLSVAYDEFLSGHAANQKKLKTFKNLFINNFVGDKKIDQLTQKEVNHFFRLLVKCPGGRGGNTDAFNKL